MSRKKKTLEKQRKQNSLKQRKKVAKQAYYASFEAKEKWEEKKRSKRQSQIQKRISRGISVMCPLKSWENPSIERCDGCDLKCSFKTRLN